MSQMNRDSQIIGYTEPWIVSPGDSVDIKISSTEKKYTHRLVRLIQGLSGPHAPPLHEEEITEVPAGQRDDGSYQHACPGSYAIVRSWNQATYAADEGFEVQLYAQPYLLDVDYCQTLISCLDTTSGTGFAVVLKNSRLEFWIGTGTAGQVEVVQSQFPVNRWRWLRVRLSLVGTKFISNIQQINRLAEKAPTQEETTKCLSAPMVLGSNALMFAAGMFKDIDQSSANPSSFFNGRLDSPSFRTGPSQREIAQYDFSQEIPSDCIIDVSGNGRHGVLVNAPTRAVKGYDWDGSEPDWTKAKYGYGAIHFHEDDLDDAKWDTSFSLTVPATARSGAYAVEAKCSGGASDMITFFVRPNPTSTARVALVLSTFTYLAYANERMFDETKSSAMTVPDGVSIGSEDEYYKNMVQRPDLGLSAYDVHKDGSPCVFSSARRPILNLRPGYVHWALGRPREFSADLLMIGFLERSGIPYDIITDHCLHISGEQATSQYTTMVTSCHPEYHSLQTLDAFSDFAKTGRNLMYLGGNGFYWVADIDSSRPHRLEVRKGDQGCRSVTLPPGERMHGQTGAQGGLWRSRGRAPNYLFGIGPCAFGTGKGKPYKANSEYAKDPSLAWIFDGISPDEDIGKYGFGGGASGDEIDRLDYQLGTPSNTILLGSSHRHDDSFGLFNEDSMFPMVNTLGSNCDLVRSDLIYYETSGGGGVFAVGSINWYGSLAWDGYSNNVARMTGNVLKEFVRRGEQVSR